MLFIFPKQPLHFHFTGNYHLLVPPQFSAVRIGRAVEEPQLLSVCRVRHSASEGLLRPRPVFRKNLLQPQHVCLFVLRFGKFPVK